VPRKLDKTEKTSKTHIKASAKLQIKEYKESLILEAAAKLFHERGFQGTTLDDIAAELGVTKPFIYTYFKSKYHLLESLFDRAYDDLYVTVTEFRKLPGNDPVKSLMYFVDAYIDQNFKRQEFTALMLREEKNLEADKQADMKAKQREFDRLLVSLINDGVQAGVFHVDDPALTSLAISGMVRWTHRWYSPTGRLSPEAVRAQLTQIALRMVGYAPALAVAGDGPEEAAPAKAARKQVGVQA
jgi:AcrR family transcriptional regulator